MSSRGAYAAVHLGDGVVSVLLASGPVVAQDRYETALSMHAGTPVYLDGDLVPGGTRSDIGGRAPMDSVGAVERYPFEFVADEEILVGETAVPMAQVLTGTIAAALHRIGARGSVDLLEVACPSSWGVARHRIVRRAVTSLAREVLVVDAATAVVQSPGERAPSFAVVVEVGELRSTVSSLRRAAVPEVYVRSGKSEEIGSRDIGRTPDLDASVAARVAGCVAAQETTGPVDVFVLDVSRRGDASTILADSPYRCRRLRDGDVVRSMAARIGMSEPEPDLPESEPSVRGAPLSYPDSGQGRTAAWLTNIDPPASAGRPRVSAWLAAAVGVVVLGAVVLGAFVFAGLPTPVATPASSPVVRPPSAVPPSVVPSSPASTSPNEAAPSTEDTVPVPESRVFYSGRASVGLPVQWSERQESDRILLVPPDLPDRRIVLATTELAGTTSLDQVADELEELILAGGADSTFDGFTRATDFGGRTGVSYNESPGDRSVVRWRVFVEQGLQVSIGCQSSLGEEEALADDCSRAMSTLLVSGPE